MTKRYTSNNIEYDVAENRLDEFLKDHPDAVLVEDQQDGIEVEPIEEVTKDVVLESGIQSSTQEDIDQSNELVGGTYQLPEEKVKEAVSNAGEAFDDILQNSSGRYSNELLLKEANMDTPETSERGFNEGIKLPYIEELMAGGVALVKEEYYQGNLSLPGPGSPMGMEFFSPYMKKLLGNKKRDGKDLMTDEEQRDYDALTAIKTQTAEQILRRDGKNPTSDDVQQYIIDNKDSPAFEQQLRNTFTQDYVNKERTAYIKNLNKLFVEAENPAVNLGQLAKQGLFKSEIQKKAEKEGEEIKKDIEDKENENIVLEKNAAFQVKALADEINSLMKITPKTREEGIEIVTKIKGLMETYEAWKPAYEEYAEAAIDISQDNASINRYLDAVGRNEGWLVNPIGALGVASIDMLNALSETADRIVGPDMWELASNYILGEDNIISKGFQGVSNVVDSGQRKVDDFTKNISAGLAVPLSVDDIDGWTDFGQWAGHLIGSQTPNTVVMLTTGGFALPILGASATGTSFLSMQREIDLYGAEYTPFQMYSVALGTGLAEALSEKVTFGQLNRIKKGLSINKKLNYGIKKWARSLLTQRGLSKTGKELLIYGKDTFEEGFSETLAGYTQRYLEREILGKDVNLFNGMKDEFISGAFMSGVVYKAPGIGLGMIKPFQRAGSIQLIGELRTQFNEITKRLEDNPNMVKSLQSELQSQAQEKLNQINQILSKDISNIDKMTPEEKQKLIDFTYKKYKLHKLYDKVQEDDSMDADTKKFMNNALNGQYKKLQEQKDILLGEVNTREDIATSRAKHKEAGGKDEDFKVIETDEEYNDTYSMKDAKKDSKGVLRDEEGNEVFAEGHYTKDGGVVINREAMLKSAILNGGNISTASHELLHKVLEVEFADPKKGKALARKFMATLKKFDPRAYNDVYKRLINGGYISKMPDNLTEQEEQEFLDQEKEMGYNEYLTQYYDHVRDNKRKYNQLDKGFLEQVMNFFTERLGKVAKVDPNDISFKDGKDMYNFVQNYAKDIKEDKISDRSKAFIKKGEETTVDTESKQTSASRKKDTSQKDIDELATQYKKDPASADPVGLVEQYTKIALTALGYKVGKGTVQPKEAISFVNSQFDSILRRWDGEQKLSTWIYANIQPKKQEFYESEIGDAAQTTSIDDERAQQIAAEETPTAEAKEEKTPTLIDPRILTNVKNKIKEIEREVKIKKEEVALSNFKYISDKFGAKVASIIYNIPEAKIKDATKNLTYAKKIIDGIPENSEAGSIQNDFSKVDEVRRFLRILPPYNVSTSESTINKQGETIPVSKDVKGRSLGLSGVVQDYFYENYIDPKGEITNPKGRSKGSTSQPVVKRLKPQFRDNISNETIQQLQKDLGITPVGKLNIYNRTIGQFLKGVAKLKGAITANTVIDQQIESLDVKTAKGKKQVTADTRAGRSTVQAKKRKVDKEGNPVLRQGKETIEGVKALGKILVPIFGLKLTKRILGTQTLSPAGNRPFGYTKEGEKNKNGAITRGLSFITSLTRLKKNYGKRELDDFKKAYAEGKISTVNELHEYLDNLGLDIDTKDTNDILKAIFSSKKLITSKGSFENVNKIKTKLLNDLREIYVKNPKMLDAINSITYNTASSSHWARNLATLIGREVGETKGYEEHMIPFLAHHNTLIAALKLPEKQWKEFVKWSNDNYWQEGISNETRRTLDQPTRTNETYGPWFGKDKYHPLLAQHIKEALAGTRKWSDVISPDVRKYSGYKSVNKTYKPVNPNTQRRLGETDAQRYNVEVAKKYQNNPMVIEKQNELIYEILTKTVTQKDAAKKLELFIKTVPELKAAVKHSKKIFGKKLNNTDTTGQQVDILKTYDEAADKARSLKTPEKGISVFDFDDTLAKTNSKVLYELPNGKTGKLSATEFAAKSASLEDAGAIFDFNEFSKVVEGKKGPLANLALKRQGKFGSKDIFILTARPQESAQAIHDFLKGIGLEIPLSNITGLENGTPIAKANWVAEKAAEGYNNFYFADDQIKNVKAVKEILDQVDVKSKVQQVKFSKKRRLNDEFNIIIEKKTGLGRNKQYSPARAKTIGASKGKWNFWIPYSAEDFVGLMYPLLSKGKEGDAQMAWLKKNLLDPFNRAEAAMTQAKISVANDFTALKKQFKTIPKTLKKEAVDGFTYESALRVYIWNKQGDDIPGLAKKDIDELIKFIESDIELEGFANELIRIQKGKPYPAPTDTWLGGNLTTDIIGGINTVNRAEYLQEWQENVDIIFTPENMAKLEATHGKLYVEALTNILTRMKKGTNKLETGNRVVNDVLEWVNNSVGAIMFLNTRSAVLQTISAINFINWSDNNVLAAGKAFANQPQYWKDFKRLFNSDFLVSRRKGLKINVTESEIADAAEKGSVRGVISMLLKKGFVFTQIADSFAIASGGATFYRNRLNKLMKEGMSEQDAEKQAFLDFYDVAEESQQSSRTDRISMQQASSAGRVILAFGNTPMQYGRLMKKAALDLKNDRGDWKANVSKIIYYGVVQNIIFNAVQNALFALAFTDDDDDEDFANTKVIRTANGMMDSILRGLGIGGAVVSTGKNIILKLAEEAGKSRPKYDEAAWEMLKFSPPISSKISKVRSALRTLEWNAKEIQEKGFSLDNPAYMAAAQVVSATTNIPLDRVIKKGNNIADAVGDESEAWQKLALILGWSMWELEPRGSKNKSSNKKRKKKLPRALI